MAGHDEVSLSLGAVDSKLTYYYQDAGLCEAREEREEPNQTQLRTKRGTAHHFQRLHDSSDTARRRPLFGLGTMPA